MNSISKTRRRPSRRVLAVAGACIIVAAAVHCSAIDSDDACSPGDQDGVNGGQYTVLVSVSDTGFTVGGVDSGSTEPNIAVQNFGKVTLTLTNVGTKPHDMIIQCIPTGLGAGCPATSCFPPDADIPTLAPSASVTTTFVTPAVEGAYPFISDLPGDVDASANGAVTGLVGEFVLM